MTTTPFSWKVIGLAVGVLIVALVVAFFLTGRSHPTGLTQNLLRSDGEQGAFKMWQTALERLDKVVTALEDNAGDFKGFEKAVGDIRRESYDDIKAFREEGEAARTTLNEEDQTYFKDELKRKGAKITELLESYPEAERAHIRNEISTLR